VKRSRSSGSNGSKKVSTSFVLPRDASEEKEPAPDSIRGEGWNDLNASDRSEKNAF
jgi:hypothetical protein